MNHSKNTPTVNIVFVLAVAFLFVASVLLVLLMGARVYGNIEEASSSRHNERVCLSYLVVKARASDRAENAVRVGTFGGAPALYLEERFDDTAYETVIYVYDGWVRELFREKGLELPPASGVPIVEAESLAFHFERAGLLAIEYTGRNGDSRVAFARLRSLGEEGP